MLSQQPEGHDRGSVAVYTVVFALAVTFLLALIVDGGMAMNARQRAADVAGEAARAAAGTIDIAVLRTRGVAVIGPGACMAAARVVSAYRPEPGSGVDTVTALTLESCAAAPGSDTATVRVLVTTRPLVPGVLGGFRESAQASAIAQCGIQRGGAC